MTVNSQLGLTGLREDELPRGIRVSTEYIPQMGSVSLGLWIATGVKHEPPGLQGVTHLLEHMLFKGTETRSAKDIAEAIDGVGGQLNGFTDREYTCIYARVLKAHLPLAAEILLDMLLRSRFDPEELEREKEVVVQEIVHYEDAPDEWVDDLFVQRAWADHPLGRSLLGKEESIRAMGRKALLDYYRGRRTPDRILVAAAGNVSHDDLVELAAHSLSSLSGRAGDPVEIEPRLQAGEHFVFRPTEQVHFCLGTRGCSYVHDGRFVLALIDTILGGGPSSRLFQEIREKRGLVYEIGSSAQTYRQGGLFSVAASTAPKHFREVLGLIRNEIARVGKEGLSEAEIARAKEQMKGGLALAWESTGFRMQHLAISKIYWGRSVPFQEVMDKIDAVTSEQVSELAASLFVEDAETLVAIGPLPEWRGRQA